MYHFHIILGCIFYISSPRWISSSRLYDSGNVSLSYILIPSNELAIEMGRILVEKKVAARVTIVPNISSVYDFKSSNFVQESLMLVIFKSSVVHKLWLEIQRKHPHPAIDFITFPVKRGNEEFLDWVLTLVPEVEEQVTINQTLFETTTVRKRKRAKKKATTKAHKHKHSHSRHREKPRDQDNY